MNGDFVRDFDINLLSKTLKLHQRLQGDVSCVVWDASIVLAKYLEKLCENEGNFLENSNVVELGSGVGCVGLTAACLGYEHNLKINRANVLLTDLPEALPLLKLNVENNKSNWQNSAGHAEAASLIWGEDSDLKFEPDLILLADCVYYEKSIDCLVITLRDMATSRTKIFLSQELRDSEKQRECWKYFVNRVSQYFTLNDVPLSEQNADYSSPDILLVRLAKL